MSPKKILIISSLNPTVGAGKVAEDMYKALKNHNYDVDLLTKYKIDSHPYEYIYETKSPIKLYNNNTIKAISSIYNVIKGRKVLQRKNYGFFYKKESEPPVPIQDVLCRIHKDYDAVIVMFWQTLLSFKTVEAIYDKLKCQIHFGCTDYSPMAGGCHFPGSCDNYITGCSKCPAIYFSSFFNFPRFNISFRKRVCEKVKPIVWVNTYMANYFKKSYLYRDYSRLETVYPLVETDLFAPRNIEDCRRKLDIPQNKSFILFFGCQYLHDKRKGINYLLDALHIFSSYLTDNEKKTVFILVAGVFFELIQNELEFDYKYLGYVDIAKLPYIYSASSLFLCSSVIDAGPVMVNQSMSCGTPVVSFEIGTALDVLKNKETGYCAELENAKDFADGIYKIFQMKKNDYLAMRHRCRNLALGLTSEKARADWFRNIYNKYK